MTWPLVTVLGTRIGGDLGDPLFNAWILRWTSTHVLRALHGDLSALSSYWHGNIFYPARLTLAYSEHLTPQMLQMLPVMAATGNVILCYNLLLLSTFVLSGLGMYLLVRELTGRPLAALFAGLAFACMPYRVDQFTHLQVLSSQWMPFAFYGFRRFFVTARLRPLVGGAAALVAQALSCGYYLAFFTPFAVLYCLYEMTVRGMLRDLRAWRALVAAGAGSLLLIGLFLWPYAQARRLADVGVRDVAEIREFSADTYAFATITPDSKLWGARIRALPKNEGQGFPGFAILTFAAAAVGLGFLRAVAHARRAGTQAARWRHVVAAVVSVMLVGVLLLLSHTLVTGRLVLSIAGFAVRKRDTIRLLAEIAILAAVALAASPLARRIARGLPESTLAFFSWAAVAAAWLSLGPMMYANGRPIGPGLYNVLYRWVPWFDGLRAVSLYFMLVAFFLAVLAGLGAAALVAGGRRAGRLLVVAGMIAIVAESWSVPAAINVHLSADGYAQPSDDIADVPKLAGVYGVIRDLPARTVVAEFPFGDEAYEIRYVFAAAHHGKPIVNGYSGFEPEHYRQLKAVLAHMPSDPGGWNALVASGVTHAIVHEDAFLHGDGTRVSAWLRRHGARDIVAAQGDRVFQLP